MDFEALKQMGNLSPEVMLIIQVFVVVFATLMLDFIVKLLFRRIKARVERSETLWDDALFNASKRPLTLLIWLIGIAFAADIVGNQTDTLLFEAVSPIRDVGVITIIAWFLLRFIREVEQNVLTRAQRLGKQVDPTTVDAIGKLFRLSVVITSVLVGMQTLGFSISGILAFGGIGGIAVGFAAKDLLANFFGGLMIYLDRPFAVGEWIRSPDREIEGTVEHIGWRLTKIRTFDKRPLYVPNATFANVAVENPSRMSHRRIFETVGIRYDDALRMQPIIDRVHQMLVDHPEIDESQTLIVNFNKFAPSSLDFFIYTFTHTTNWVEFHRIKQDVLLKVIEIIDSEGAEIAFPTSTIHVPEALRMEGLEVRPASQP